ncbi:biotin--[acetyl-CoA-carboxylase] ligase [Algoriphagus confluentis]|uniref:biotin--[biotin carboxyl-carrier protein] ligase n=1 Tax=Algoriphagus confluentis TaxID=1697556 RepID=A0ABQ6PRG4_9BACT|nr:biotin--[acetyl-CoA-carboxylase] ligase [Algoriphagus confluentis]
MYKILANTIFLGKDVLFLPECHSTNDTAMQLVRSEKAKEGSVVICGHQSKGKGQRGNSWEVEPGKNLTFTLVLRPDFLDISQQFLLNMMVSNALLKVLKDYIPDLQVKWPNDLVVPGIGKLGGILIENIVGLSGWEYALVGVGININQINFLPQKACSLSSLTGSDYNLEEVFRLLIAQLEQGYIALKKNKHKEIRENYLRHLFRLEEWALYQMGKREVLGKIIGISSDGKLVLEYENGDHQEFGLKEIQFTNL